MVNSGFTARGEEGVFILKLNLGSGGYLLRQRVDKYWSPYTHLNYTRRRPSPDLFLPVQDGKQEKRKEDRFDVRVTLGKTRYGYSCYRVLFTCCSIFLGPRGSDTLTTRYHLTNRTSRYTLPSFKDLTNLLIISPDVEGGVESVFSRTRDLGKQSFGTQRGGLC